MDARKGYYTLIQFRPDASRLEAVNMGVLLFCPETGFIGARLAKSNQRAAKLVGRAQLNSAALNSAKRALERRLKIDSAAFKTLGDLQHFIDSRGNILQLTPPRSVKVFDPETDLDKLFSELVGGHPRQLVGTAGAPGPGDKVVTALDGFFRRLAQEGRARLNWDVEVPLVGRHLHIPFAFRNGAWNLVKPWRFSGQEKRALSAAMHLAVEGDLIHRHGKDEDGEKKLIVVSSFEEPVHAKDLEGRVAEVLHEYSVDMVAPGQVSLFTSRVEKLTFFTGKPTVLPGAPRGDAASLVRIDFKLTDGIGGTMVPVFMGAELADRFLPSLGETGKGMATFELDSFDVLEALLLDLKKAGTTHVNFNADRNKPNPIPIGEVIDSLRNRHDEPAMGHVGQWLSREEQNDREAEGSMLALLGSGTSLESRPSGELESGRTRERQEPFSGKTVPGTDTAP